MFKTSFFKNTTILFILLFALTSCKEGNKTKLVHKNQDKAVAKQTSEKSAVTLVVLGTVQDAGSPHIACKKECCKSLFTNPDHTRQVVSLGLIDHKNQQTFLFEATPDVSQQVKFLKNSASWECFVGH